MEFFDWFFIIIFSIGLFSLAFIWVIFPIIERNHLTDFCQKEGYANGDFRNTIFQKSYCIKIEGNKIIKQEVESCNHRGITLYDWCFVEEDRRKGR